MAEHTPTPWVSYLYEDTIAIHGADDVRVAKSSWHSTRRDPHPLKAEALENFAFIVEAVNNYATLAQKLQSCVHALTFCLDGWDESDPYIQKLRVTRDGAQKALDALAKVGA